MRGCHLLALRHLRVNGDRTDSCITVVDLPKVRRRAARLRQLNRRVREGRGAAHQVRREPLILERGSQEHICRVSLCGIILVVVGVLSNLLGRWKNG